MSQVSSEARVHIGREESVKRTLRNQRLGRIPAELDSFQDLIIDGEWAQASTAKTWYMDGNQAVAPHGLCQLYIIRCLLGNTAVSAIYALLKRVTRYLREPDMCHC